MSEFTAREYAEREGITVPAARQRLRKMHALGSVKKRSEKRREGRDPDRPFQPGKWVIERSYTVNLWRYADDVS